MYDYYRPTSSYKYLIPPAMKSHRRLSLPENPVNFIKIILSDDTGSTGIRIPKKFTEKHGKDLIESERVILKLANGDVCQVDLEQDSRNEIWLKNGWWEIAERYGLKYGDLLMFRYEGFSIFGVIIFKASGSEMVYSNNNKNDQIRNSAKRKAIKSPQQVKPTVKSEEDERPGFKINDGAEPECSRKRQKKMSKKLKATNFSVDADRF